jgi:predicted GNAT family acetyltransferase
VVIRVEHAWVVKDNEQVVCRAISVRQNAECAEVYVETHPNFRRRGYGRQTVAAWAHDILSSGRVPFYSYHLSNNSSANLARSLGVVWYADLVAFVPSSY